MREVQYSVADAQRRAIGMHVAQPDGQVRERSVGRDIERHDRRSEDLDARIERRGLEHQRTCIVVLLIAGLIGAAAKRTPAPGVLANRLRRAHGPRRQARVARLQSAIGEEQAMRLDIVGGGHDGFGDPPPRQLS